MAVLDTAEDWAWWLCCWDYVLDAAEVAAADVAMMAFSFGPFIGFWTANDALVKRGSLVIPGGGLSSENRLRLIQDQGCTVLCCTPTYALHLLAVAEQLGLDMAQSKIRRVIVAGEPGGSIDSIRTRIEKGWGAVVIDHSGASEVGAWGFGDSSGEGLHVIETEFIAEVLRVDENYPRGLPVAEGESGELVLTSLGRLGGPVIRYRTGDVVKAYRDHGRDCPFLWLEGGVIGRADDMLVIRGVNVFPSSVESIVRESLPYEEFRMIASRINEMDQLEIEIEAGQEDVDSLSAKLRDRLSLRVPVRSVPAGTLPRFEAKARRLVDQR
jgi:phenylacetate-CoA ligase